MYPELIRAIQLDERKQKVIAYHANITEERLSSLLNANGKLRFDEAVRLARVLGRPFDELFPEVRELLSRPEATVATA